MVALDRRLSNRLTDLAERAAGVHREYQSHREAAAACIVTFGRLLNEAKAECSHGEWEPFLVRAGIPERTARRAMRIAAAHLKSATVADLGVKETDRLIGMVKRCGLEVGEDSVRTAHFMEEMRAFAVDTVRKLAKAENGVQAREAWATWAEPATDSDSAEPELWAAEFLIRFSKAVDASAEALGCSAPELFAAFEAA